MSLIHKMFYPNTMVHMTNTLLTTHSPHGYFHALASYMCNANLTLCGVLPLRFKCKGVYGSENTWLMCGASCFTFIYLNLIEPYFKELVLHHNKWWHPHFFGGDFGLFVSCIGQVSNYGLHMVASIWNRNIKAFHHAFHSWEVIQTRFHYHVDEKVLWDRYLSIMEQWRHILIEHEEGIFFGGEWIGFFLDPKDRFHVPVFQIPCESITKRGFTQLLLEVFPKVQRCNFQSMWVSSWRPSYCLQWLAPPNACWYHCVWSKVGRNPISCVVGQMRRCLIMMNGGGQAHMSFVL